MTLLETFNIVDLHGKMNIINEQGEFIVTREHYHQKVNLYALPKFYAEVYYHHDIKQITKINAITSQDDLTEYLRYIDISL